MNNAPIRSYVRHRSDIPVEVLFEQVVADESTYLNNISQGGLSFNAMVALRIGSVIRIRLPLKKPLFEALGRVAWVKKMGFYYVVGIEFMDMDENFRLQMVDLICRIEEYKREILEKQQRSLSGQQAALEWMQHHASEFRSDSNIANR